MANNLSDEELNKFAEIIGSVTRQYQEQSEAQRDLINADKQAKEVTEKLNRAYDQAAAGLKSLNNGLLTAGGGMTKYTDSIKNMGDAVGNVVGVLGPLGKAIEGVIKIFTAVAGAVLKQNEAVLKAADSLAQFGVNSNLTSKEILRLAHSAGYSSHNLETFTKIQQKVGTDLVGLGLTASSGVKAFAKLIEADQKVLEGFRNLGVTQEQLNEHQADFIKLQILSGQQITERMKTDGSLRKASLEYTNNLIELSAITGEDINNIKKQQEAAAANINLQLKIADLDEKEAEFRRKNMPVEAERIATEKKAMMELSTMAGLIGLSGEDLAGFNQLLATGNFTELSKNFATLNVDILGFMDDVKKGKREPAELRQFFADSTKNARQRYGEAAQYSKEAQSAFILTSKMNQNEAKFRGKSLEEINKMIQKEIEDRKKQQSGDIVDAEKKARNAQESAERNYRIMQDKFVGLISGPVTSAFEKLMQVMQWVVKGLAKVAGTLLNLPELEEMFMTPQEKAESAIKKLKNEINQLETESETGAPTTLATGDVVGSATTQKSRVLTPEEKQQVARKKLQLVEKQKELAAARGEQVPTPTAVESGKRGRQAGAKPNNDTGMQTTTQDALKRMGIIIKDGDVHKDHSEINPNLINLAKSIQDNVSGFKYFSAFNDEYHQKNSPGSKHAKGAALDFTVDEKPTPEEGKEMVNWLKSIGATSALDEYNNPSEKATGGHFHAEIQLAKGGIATGPKSGYPAILHGNEAVIPLDPNSILTTLMKTPMAELENSITATNNAITNMPTQNTEMLENLMDLLTNKLDNVLRVLESSNNTQEKILQYSRI